MSTTTSPTRWQAPHAPGPAGPRWRSPGYRSSWLRSQVVRVVLGVTVGVDALLLLLAIEGFDLVDRVVAGLAGTTEADAYDTLVALVSDLDTLLFVGTAVALLAWLSRVVENVPPLTGETPEHGPRGAIGWWFAPFASYVVPFLIVRDTMRRLRIGASTRGEWSLLPWWLLFALASLSSYALLFIGQDLATLDDIRGLLTARALNSAAYAAAGVLLFLVISEVQRRSDGRARALGLGASGRPEWPALHPKLHPGLTGTPGPLPAPLIVAAGAASAPPPPPPMRW